MISFSPLAGPVCMLPLAAAIPWGYVAAGLMLWLGTTAATWLVANKVASTSLRKDIEQLKAAVEKLSEQLEELPKSIGEIREQRVQCELRATRHFAGRGELANLLAEAAAQSGRVYKKLDEMQDGFRNSIGKVHGRVDELVTGMSRLQGPKGAEL